MKALLLAAVAAAGCSLPEIMPRVPQSSPQSSQMTCPTVAGELLSLCADTCYSTGQYSCTAAGELKPLPPFSGIFSLTASNPGLPSTIDGQPITACDETFWVGGETCAVCVDPSVEDCPPGNVTTFNAFPDGSVISLSVDTPGGQGLYFGSDWTIGYTMPHSANMPPGSKYIQDLFALSGGEDGQGAFIDRGNSGQGQDSVDHGGWAACPAQGVSGSSWKVFARNGSGGSQLGQGCVPIRLLVVKQESQGAWEYA